MALILIIQNPFLPVAHPLFDERKRPAAQSSFAFLGGFSDHQPTFSSLPPQKSPTKSARYLPMNIQQFYNSVTTVSF